MIALDSIISTGLKIIDKVIPDKDARDKARLKLLELQQNGELAVISQQAKVIVAEANSESWITRSWRPILMMTYVAIMINNFIIAPYARAFGFELVTLEMTPAMWGMMTVGVGGYIGGRSYEKSQSKD